jgi:hypothetical protein
MFRRIFMIRPPWRSAETRQSAEKGEAKSCARTKDIAKKNNECNRPKLHPACHSSIKRMEGGAVSLLVHNSV